MEQICVQLFGLPIVKINNTIINFPYKKCEGLFYYLCIHKKSTREELINIFWADTDEQSARKNLRDALYNIKKSICDNIFSSKSKSIIGFDESLDIALDIDSIDASNILTLCSSELLQNFSIKNCYDFENWIQEQRDFYKDMYIKAVTKKVNELVNIGDFKSIQKYSSILINNDVYNEKTYRDIMKIYALYGDYNKAIKLYYDLTSLLKTDLDIEPENSTKDMFHQILKLKDTSMVIHETATFFYGRFDEIYALNINLSNFDVGSGSSVLLSGEAGIGKTSLLNKILSNIDSSKYILLKSNCYHAEEDFFLKPWHSIFTQIGNYIKSHKIYVNQEQEKIISYVFPGFNKNIKVGDFDKIDSIDTTRYEIAANAIIELLSMLSAKKKIIFIFDDMQWMDKMSKVLLTNILTHFANKNIILLGAYRDDFENKLSSFIIPLINSDVLKEIKLKRFTFDETEHIISQYLPNLNTNSSLLTDIYNDTEGNALFLIELLKVVKDKGYTKELSSKATNIIKSRIIDLTKDEKAVINAISIFFDKVSINNLKLIVPFDELQIFDIIESLQEKHLIQEIITDKDIFYRFTHQQIREYIYNTQSMGKKKMLHQKIALYLEENYKSSSNSDLYPSLIYHFEKGGNSYKSLKYKIENLIEYYTIYHETYPIVSFDINYSCENENVFNVKEKLTALLIELENIKNNSAEYQMLKMELTYLMGRYCISVGEYHAGLENIDTSMKIAENLQNNIYLIDNYKQMIFYSIQVHDMTVMNKYINKSLNLLEKNNNIEERGTILRLKGLYCIKTKNYTAAIDLLKESVNIFLNLNKIQDKYTLSIAASYNYLGQMYKYMANFPEAYSYFMKSIELCSEHSITKGLGIFYSNAGQALYEMDNFLESEICISKSLCLFQLHDEIWGRDMAEGYAALIEFKNKNTDEALQHYEKALVLSKKLNNPKSIQLCNKIKKLLCN